MPKIIDPDNLTSGVSIFWSTGSVETRRIGVSSSIDSAGSLVPPLSSGSDSGVSFQCLYSFAKEEWKNTDTLIRIPFPFVSITKNQFDIINYWDFADDSSRYLIRDAGWSVISGSTTTHEYIGIRTLGSLRFDLTTVPPDPTLCDQVYFVQSGSDSASVSLTIQNFQMSGAVNQAILHYSASDVTAERDFRGSTDLYVREYKQIYDAANIQDDLGVTTQEYTLYSVPLQNTTDLKITTTTEAQAASEGPWDKVDIYFLTGSGFIASGSDGNPTYAGLVVSASDGNWYIDNAGTQTGPPPGNNWALFAYPSPVAVATPYGVSGSQQISGSGEYTVFNVVVTNGTGSFAQTGSTEDIYTSVQYQLRQNSDIDKGNAYPNNTWIGKRTPVLMTFVGDTLVTSNGVFVDNQQNADTNTIDFYDVSGSVARYPFVATGIISFNDNLLNDVSGSFFMFFTTLPDPTGSFGLPAALLVNDNVGNPISGSTYNDNDGYDFTFDYDGNSQGGRGSGTDAPVTVVAIGFSTAAYVTVTSTILKSTSNNISLVSALERNYENPE